MSLADPNDTVSFFASLPTAAWTAFGVIGGALITALGAWLIRKRADKSDAGTLALGLVSALQDTITRLEARVETLERKSDSYRNWSHVLWTHIHDDTTPRTPAPTWPTDLPR